MAATKEDVPSIEKLINPTLAALHKLGGSASINELVDEIVNGMGLSAEVADIPHGGEGGNSELAYRAAWARTYLRWTGLIENSDRGVWALTPKGAKTTQVKAKELVRRILREQRERRMTRKARTDAAPDTEDQDSDWQSQLLSILRVMDPIAFERLCQRLLRESGFIEVEVTQRTGDGGIDGHGIIRLGGLISFPVLFQSKRYKANIGAGTVRDFRGAMVGRADKGLLITTGGFTREARLEATRDGAPPIDLIDGEQLAEKLKELGLGVSTRLVEEVEIHPSWFQSI